MQTATNEGREPWLDEGLTEYSGMRYMVDAGRKVFFGGQPADPETFELARYDGLRLPATLPSWEYDTAARYFPSVYNKTALGLWTLESIVGTERFRHAMADYLARYRFKHPTGADFRASLERSLGGDLRWFFDDYMNGSGVIDYAVDRNDGRTVMVTRAGTVRAPVEIGVTLASGARLLKTWDGQTPSASFAFPAGDPVKKVEIDPEHKLKAEVDRVNNTSAVP
jgi:hypothetical protein